LCALIYKGDEMKEDLWGHVTGKEKLRNYYSILVRKHEGKT